MREPHQTELTGVSAEHAVFKRVFKSKLFGVDRSRESIHGVEIGVLNGATSKFIMGLSKNVHLIGIDPLVPDSMESSLIGSLDNINENTEKFGDRWQFVKSWSWAVVDQFHDNSLDFVFIDGSHIYSDVLEDFQLYKPKVTVGGVILFHDSRMSRGGPPFWPGPSQLVDDLISTNASVSLIDEDFSLTAFEVIW